MKAIVIFGFFLIGFSSVMASSYCNVSNQRDSGTGSLRAALNAGKSEIIFCPGVRNITLQRPLVFEGGSALSLHGQPTTLDASKLNPQSSILTIKATPTINIDNVAFVGSHTQINTQSNRPIHGSAIAIILEQNQTHATLVSLKTLYISDIAGHGVHISDCSKYLECGAGNSADGEGSPASLRLRADDLLLTRVGYGKADADGIRIDERGAGNITLQLTNSAFNHIGGDAIELDETGKGDVIASIENTQFLYNGDYCQHLPEFANTACDDDGERDLDDGFDIDEAGDGDIKVTIANTRFIGNLDEGVDLDEYDEGNIIVHIKNTRFIGNQDEGIKVSENDVGDIRAQVEAIHSYQNNDEKEGVEFKEKGQGNLLVKMQYAYFLGGTSEAIKVSQKNLGQGKLYIADSVIEKVDTQGVALEK